MIISFSHYIKPNVRIEPHATAIHGLTARRLKHAPRFADIANEFLEFVGDDDVVVHEENFTRVFLNKAIQNTIGGSIPKNQFIDVKNVEKRAPGLKKGFRNIGLRD